MAKTPEQRRADNAAYMRRQRAEHPEKYKAKSQEFIARHHERIKAERNARYAKNKANIRAGRYGTVKELIDALLVLQGGCCAVCEKELAPWPSGATHIDHCHDTDVVRGLLCRSCNMKEGWVRRYGERLSAYLAKPPAAQLQELA